MMTRTCLGESAASPRTKLLHETISRASHLHVDQSILETAPIKMPTPIEQALITLLPTLNVLPPELIDLSTSLLAQSRTKAATLKQEEEIGRVFACAHLAVDRLKQRLDLGDGKVVARPPVPPRVYKKLYGYLDAALTPATPRAARVRDVETPGSRGLRSQAETPSKTPTAGLGGAVVTPSKTPASTAQSLGSTTASGRRTRSAAKVHEEEEAQDQVKEDDQEQEKKQYTLPSQVSPMVTVVCTALDAPQAEPHICSALSSILQLRGWGDSNSKKRKTTPQSSASKRRRTTTGTESIPAQETPEPITSSSLPALLVAVSLVTTFTLRDTIIDGTAYTSARATAISALESQAPSPADVDAFLHASKKEGWLDLPWLTAVKAAAVSAATPAQTPKKGKLPAKTPLRRKEKHAKRPIAKDVEGDTEMMDVDEAADENRPSAGLKWGLGTMFQDSVDWLNDERRSSYREWEKDVRRRCAEIERENVAV